MRGADTLDEARRAMEICNACRYCGGYCTTFQAMELRRGFSDADLTHLANLCHNCRSCYHACQYAPPHPFAVNVPARFAEIRLRSYREHAWPRPLGRLFGRNGTAILLAALGATALVFLLVVLLRPAADLVRPHHGPGAFYAVVPWSVMAAVAGATAGWSLLALVVSVAGFWRSLGKPPACTDGAGAVLAGLRDALTLRNLGGGGPGCSERDDRMSSARRRLHHAVFYGFGLCFASTGVATVYHHGFGWDAPYPLTSLPVVLGTVGGVGMVVGTVGLALLRMRADPKPEAAGTRGADRAFLGLLFAVAASGLALLGLRGTAAMAVLLLLHLGTVLGFFLTLPYSKFVHGFYRAAALVRAAMELRAARGPDLRRGTKATDGGR